MEISLGREASQLVHVNIKLRYVLLGVLDVCRFEEYLLVIQKMSPSVRYRGGSLGKNKATLKCEIFK